MQDFYFWEDGVDAFSLLFALGTTKPSVLHVKQIEDNSEKCRKKGRPARDLRNDMK